MQLGKHFYVTIITCYVNTNNKQLYVMIEE